MNIEISTEQLTVDIRGMREQISQLDSSRVRVFNCLEELSGMWVGTAHEAFRTQTELDSQQLKDLIDELNQLVDCVEYARTQYDICENEAEKAVAAIRLSDER